MNIKTHSTEFASYPYVICMCVSMYVCCWVQVCGWICMWQPDDNLRCPSSGILCSYFCEAYLCWPGAHHKGLESWPVSLRDHIVSALSVVGLALASQAAFFSLWFPETWFRPICLQGKHSNDFTSSCVLLQTFFYDKLLNNSKIY